VGRPGEIIQGVVSVKKRVAVAAALLAAVIAMTGVAVADQVNIFEKDTTNRPGQITLPRGGEVNLDLVVSGFENSAGTIHKMKIELLDFKRIKPATGLQVMINDVAVPLGPGGIFPSDKIISWKQSAGAGGSEKLNLKIKDISGASRDFEIKVADVGSADQAARATVKVAAPPREISIPEFPSVALPTAAIIGLVFLFQHRKRRGKR